VHIAVIGAIGKIKGYDVLLECARDARDRRLPVVFSVLGYSMNDAQLGFAGVRVSGRYLESEALDRLEAMAPHAVWLPSLWPETYSYTLSLALQAGLPVFAFDIGAIARRLGELGRAQLCMPLELARRPTAINARFLDYRQSVAAPAPVTIAAPRRRIGKGQ
jgi:glycosyltransferase involved in cell wall biosynthesis